MKKILSITIGLLLIIPLAFAEPVFMVEEVIDKIEILREGNIQTLKSRRVYMDGKLISISYIDRQVYTPDTEIADLPTKRVKDIANVVWTTEVIAKYRAEMVRRNLDNQ